MKKLLYCALALPLIWSCNSPKKEEPVKTETPTEAVAQRPIDFADERFSNICKDGLMKLGNGDVDGYLSNFAEDAIYRWNNGDSLAGKSEIAKFWNDRRKNVITKLEFSDDIWLSMMVTDANTQNVRKGNWVLSWYTVNASYKTGKSMKQSMHILYHFNNNEKIDEVIQFVDRQPIIAAAGK
jgi:ketosteroid isomerase-like protein